VQAGDNNRKWTIWVKQNIELEDVEVRLLVYQWDTTGRWLFRGWILSSQSSMPSKYIRSELGNQNL
jgi:hypothetical protein